MNLFRNKSQVSSKPNICRREFLTMGLITVVSAIIPDDTFALAKEIFFSERTLCFHNPYTGEKIEALYWKEGKYIPEALAEINHILRDIRTGKVRAIDRNLLDLLFALQQKLESRKPFEIISGYRTPQSNAILRKKRKGVAKNSLHIYGKAIDIRIHGYSLKRVRREAMKLKGGGVGYYPRYNFVHIDTGGIRYWWG